MMTPRRGRISKDGHYNFFIVNVAGYLRPQKAPLMQLSPLRAKATLRISPNYATLCSSSQTVPSLTLSIHQRADFQIRFGEPSLPLPPPEAEGEIIFQLRSPFPISRAKARDGRRVTAGLTLRQSCATC
ncbi:unnamed protein product [Nezara viridula]|uniref:Uncharacterized protein n=1 Tax=Nezara viridula TaxID=85310 RepID=A0A9P0HPF1_NEZVI|nr:unnamed protein product [Nezara viridula]